MELSEFLESLGERAAMFKEYKRQQEAFCRQLSGELVEFFYAKDKAYMAHRGVTEKAIKEIAQRYAIDVLESLNLVEYRQREGLPGKKENAVPKLKTKAESEKEFEAILHLIPPENLEYAKQVHWESFEEQQEHDTFLLDIHRIMKKVLADCYQDSILALDSEYLRLLDSYIYTTAYSFADECFEILEV